MDASNSRPARASAPARIEDRGRVVAPFLDVGRIGAFHQRDISLVDDDSRARCERFPRRSESMLMRLDATVMMRLSVSVDCARSPGKSSVVASSCSMMAGPAMRCAGRQDRARWKIGVSLGRSRRETTTARCDAACAGAACASSLVPRGAGGAADDREPEVDDLDRLGSKASHRRARARRGSAAA